jgi:hypothetical protein
VSGPKRGPWEDEFTGALSPDWVVAFIVLALLVAGAIGFWFDAMYTSGTGIFAP